MEHQEFYRRHLPHWQPEGETFFVTFRLAGSLPRHVIESLKAERECELKALSEIPDETERLKRAYDDERKAFGRWDAALDSERSGPHWLRQPEIAEILSEALHYRAGKVFGLHAFCMMSNHAHVVYTPLRNEKGTYNALHRIQQSLKRHTGRQANIFLNREGAFWQEENYDHAVRDEGELNRIVRYVAYNPVKVRLVENWEDWPYTYVSDDFNP